MVLLPLLLVPLFTVSPASAQGCWIGFRTGSTPTAIDGVLGSEWNVASILDSGSACLDQFWDWNQTSWANPPTNTIPSPEEPRSVRVHSMRDAANLYLFFEVQDHTRLDVGGGELSLGDQIIVHLDPNFSRNPDQMQAGAADLQRDYRLEVINKRGTSPATVRWFDSTGTPTACNGTTKRTFNQVVPTPPGVQVGVNNQANHYNVEVAIPLSLIGSPALTGNVGIAFAVINDLGSGSAATGIAFPAGLPLSDATYGLLTDPHEPAKDCNGWIVPAAWGGGYLDVAPGSVTISRMPAFWNSEHIEPRDCSGPSYMYHAGNPCRLQLHATLRNTGPTVTTRNVLYLFGNRDAGNPRWTFMDLREGVSIPTGLHPFSSTLFPPPAALVEHPCVRVIILPPSFQASFDRARMQALNNAPHSEFQALMAAYGLNDAHWAQKNISQHTSPTSVCPDPACRVASAPLPGSGEWAAGWYRALEIPRNWQMLEALRPATAFAQQRPPQERMRLHLSGQELEQFLRSDAIVQVRSLGISTRSAYQRRTYQFIEPLGGAIQLIPATALRPPVTRGGDPTTPWGGVRVSFNVTNPDDVGRTVFLDVATHRPPGLEEMPIVIDDRPVEMGPGQTRTVTASVGAVGPQPPGTGRMGWFPLANVILLFGGITIIGLVALRPRGNRKA
jgi:hypothetical protein